jgi:nicotinamide mononucleotide transporter
MNKNFQLIIIPIITIIVSTVLGVILVDYFWGIVTLIFGFLNAYYMAIGKWYNYIFGLLFSLSYAVVCGKNGLFGWVIFTFIFYVPSQVSGMINWFKNKQDGVVEMRSLNLKKSIIVCGSILAGSSLFGYLLSLIPSQQLSFLDGSTQIVNVCGIVLSLFRFREAWYIWLINNVLDLSIWIINAINSNSDSYMMLVVSVVYLALNIVGIIEWIKIEKEQKK